MIFVEKRKNKQGQVTLCVVCSRYWPDRVRFRRRCPNKTVARNLLDRINGAIATGTWRELRKELTEPPEPREQEQTIKQFAEIYLEEYCRKRNTRPDFKEETLKTIVRLVGDVRLSEFTRNDALRFEMARSTEVAPATVNRGLAVLSNLLTFAFKKGLIPTQPMLLYGRLPEAEHERRFLTLEEERLLVEKTIDVDPVVGAYVGLLGETGLRMNEGLKLEWKHCDLTNRMLTAPGTMTKSGKNRYIPLSDSAVGFLRLNPRIVGNSSVFVRMTTGRTLRAPRKEFEEGKAAAKLEWVRGFHDLRHFRATQWLIEGKTLPEVKELLGHKDIQTTMIYAHFDRNSVQQRMLQKSVGNVIGNVNRW